MSPGVLMADALALPRLLIAKGLITADELNAERERAIVLFTQVIEVDAPKWSDYEAAKRLEAAVADYLIDGG
jgi:hypothetical protein